MAFSFFSNYPAFCSLLVNFVKTFFISVIVK